MGTLDLLHPEELFDKAAQGHATPEERARLDAHLAACPTCRFERQVRADFEAVTGASADIDDLVARALSGAKEEQAPVGPRRRRLSPLALVAAVALLGFGSFAAVAQFTGVLPKLLEQLTAPPAPTTPPAPRSGLAPPHRVALDPAPPAAPAVEAPAEPAPPAPSPASPTPGAASRGASTRAEPRGSPAAASSSPKPEAPGQASAVPADGVASPRAPARDTSAAATPDVPAPLTAPEPDALALFSRATRARVNGQTSDAIRDFRQLIARFPESRESALANAALGRLLLDRGEAASALEAFDAYLATGDLALREDALGARALALQSLGRGDEERAAWELVLRDFPSSVFAPRARARLELLAP
jgi:TolA-binding protein